MTLAVDDVFAGMNIDSADLKSAALSVATNTNLWLAVGKYLYQKVTEKKSLSAKDLQFYNRLCMLYANCTGSTALPRAWELDEKGCPLVSVNFTSAKERLDLRVASFDRCNYALKTQIIAIVANISRLFESLPKRVNTFFREQYRSDGVEAMFLSELAIWLSIDLPRYSIADRQTADMVWNRIEYCEEIQRSIREYHQDSDIANPKNTLAEIITELYVLHKNLCNAHKIATFNNRVKLIDENIIEELRGAFNILHLMLNGVDQMEFQVAGFLNPGDDRNENNALSKKYLLGKWMVKTCNVAGIVANDFRATSNISYEQINRHLSLEPSDLKKINEIGICDFLWAADAHAIARMTTAGKDAQTYLKEKAPELLNLVINIHRSILRMSSIKRLISGMQLNTAYGESWLFSGTGRPILDGLLAAVTHANNCYADALERFWDLYYVKTYAPFALKTYKDARDKTYNDMVMAQSFYTKSLKRAKEITESITQIKEYANDVAGEIESNDEKKYLLATPLYTYLSTVEGYDENNLSALKDIMRSTAPAGTQNPDRIKAELDGVRAELTEAKKQSIRFQQMLILMQLGGYEQMDIPSEYIDVLVQHALLNDDTAASEKEACQREYERVLNEAELHKKEKAADASSVKSELDQIKKKYDEEYGNAALKSTLNRFIAKTDEHSLAHQKTEATLNLVLKTLNLPTPVSPVASGSQSFFPASTPQREASQAGSVQQPTKKGTMMPDSFASDLDALKHLDYHWFWGLRYNKVPKLVNIGTEVARLLNKDVEFIRMIEAQNALNQKPAWIRFFYWLFNIDNYTYNAYLLVACKAYHTHLSCSLENNAVMKEQNKMALIVLNIGPLLYAGVKMFNILKFFRTPQELSPVNTQEERQSEANIDAHANIEKITVTQKMLPHLMELGMELQQGDIFLLADFKAASKRRFLESHPDKGGDKDIFHRVKQAVESLTEIIFSRTGSTIDSFGDNLDEYWAEFYATAVQLAADFVQISADQDRISADQDRIAADQKQIASDQKIIRERLDNFVAKTNENTLVAEQIEEQINAILQHLGEVPPLASGGHGFFASSVIQGDPSQDALEPETTKKALG